MNDGLRGLHEERITEWIKRVDARMLPESAPLALRILKVETLPPFAALRRNAFKPIRVGDVWGRDWEQAWFHVAGRIPAAWRGQEVCARINLGGEGLVHDSRGRPMESLSVHTIYPMPDFERARLRITPAARGGEPVERWIACSAAQLFGTELQNDQQGRPAPVYGKHEARVRECSLHTFRRDLWTLKQEAWILNDLMRALPAPGVRRYRILEALMQAVDAFGDGSPDEVRRSRAAMSDVLRSPCAPSDLRTTAIGHAHLDTAWLWPIAETRRKCVRTFANQLTMISRYPGYVFGASQAQQYAWVKASHPALYRNIRTAVRAGRWEILGGMWVEPDCQVSGGEALIRQILQGQRFFREEFGREARQCWLPDAFGFNGALPQILRRSGLDVFVSIKLTWNQFNRFPHHTFRWQGIDGTQIPAHFPPEGDYNSFLKPSRLRAAQDRCAEQPDVREFLTIFGIGDGGGGANDEHIDTGLRLKNLEGCPAVQFGHAQAALDRMLAHPERLPVWSGELYLEKHRGTLTTQAATKRMNRAMELRLRETEILHSALPLARYPAAELDTQWQKLLLNQFHDILPGSSITPVYADAQRDYAEIDRATRALQERAIRARFPARKNAVGFINTLSTDAETAVGLPADWKGHAVADASGKSVPVQMEQGSPVALIRVAAQGSNTLVRGAKATGAPQKSPSPEATRGGRWIMENDLIRYEFNREGLLVRAYDRIARREALTRDAGNRLELFEDLPTQWDAWEVDEHYMRTKKQRARVVSIQSCASGPVRQGLEMELTIGRSRIRQQIYLRGNSRRLDFETHVDWREDHKLLRVAFSTDIHADAASYEIPFGRIQRPTHVNTSWDWSRFECSGHRYVDVSEPTYGAALLNTGKYGHSVRGGELGTSLLRSSTMPDPSADRGVHDFTYSFLPHPGPLETSDVLAEAAQLNQPPMRMEGRDAAGFQFPIRLAPGSGLVLEAVKRADDGTGWIARVYEPMGRHARGALILDMPAARVMETNLVEKPERKLAHRGGRVRIELRPYKIMTLKVMPNSKKRVSQKTKTS